MDRKTLEWMGERVDKARRIVGRIERLKKFLELAESENAQGITINPGLSWYEALETGTDGLEITKMVIAGAAEAAKKAIQQLEEELATL